MQTKIAIIKLGGVKPPLTETTRCTMCLYYLDRVEGQEELSLCRQTSIEPAGGSVHRLVSSR